MALELTRRKTGGGSLQLLEREFAIWLINRKALHLLQHSQILDVKPSVNASKIKPSSSGFHLFFLVIAN
jgi:hypothetical protein